MIRTATFSGTVLIVAGFVATAIATEPENTESGERFKPRVGGIGRGVTAAQLRELAQGRLAARDAADLAVETAADTDNAVTIAIVAKDDHTFAVDVVRRDSARPGAVAALSEPTRS